MSHSKNCILSANCKLADTAKCNPLCQSYVGMHGYSGANGRSGNANIPKEYAFVTLVNSPVRASQPQVCNTIDKYADTFIRQFEAPSGRIKSLYLYGEPGNGKTTTACAILNAWLVRHYIGSVQRGVRPLDRPCYFLDTNAFQTLYNTFNRHNVPPDIGEPAADKYYRSQKIAMEVPFLVADDIGVRSASEAFRADLHAIINHRTVNGMPTVYTSNVPITDLHTVFDARLADRVRDQCLPVHFVGESKRGMRK